MSRRDQKNSTDRAAIITGIDRRRTNMKKRWLGFTGIGILLVTFFFSAVPARAENVDEEIRALKEHLARLEAQQFELKREATAATELLPTFSYRPGNGMMIEAADKSWSVRFSMFAYFRTDFESGRVGAGRTNGEVLGRRFRPSFFYCIDNCLYEIDAALDLDGFGTGNAKNSTNSATSSILERGVVHVHLEKINPWLPTFDFGMDVPTNISTARRGSSAINAQMEYDLLSRNNGFHTGRAGTGVVLSWDDKSLEGIGIPGRLAEFQVAMASVGEGDDGLSSFKNRKSFTTYLSLQPMTNIKNRWLSGLNFEIGGWFCNNDGRNVPPGSTDVPVDNGCNRLMIRDHGDQGRQILFDTGANSVGKGLAPYIIPGLIYEVGPYKLRAIAGFQSFADVGRTTGEKRGRNFLIGHDLFLWSPKGFLTGSVNTPGSILVGTHFERNDVSCETAARCATINGGEFHRDRIMLREWDLWYFTAPRMSVGIGVLWYDASNLRTGNGNAGNNLGVFPTNCGLACRGRGGNWTDWMLNWRYTF